MRYGTKKVKDSGIFDCIYSSSSVKICKELKKVFKYSNVM